MIIYKVLPKYLYTSCPNYSFVDLKSTELKMKKAKKQDELEESLQRLQAEFENFKKRTEKEKRDFQGFANENLIGELLPLLDNFELALKSTSNDAEFTSGMKLISNQLAQILENKGLKPIKALGQSFDPYLHEALLTEVSDKDNIILEEMQKGYTLNGKLIRHSMVKVGKKNDNKTNSNEGDPGNSN